jgi:hypothetical protein
MMVPLPPGWLCLQDCNLSGQLNQPVVIPFVLMHPDVGMALIDIAPASNPEAEVILRRRLEAARFDSIFPGFLPILHLRLDRADLPSTEAILRDAFASLPPLSVPGGDGWISVVRRALLPRDPARAATHPGLYGDRLRSPRTPAVAGPDTESDMLHREAVTVAHRGDDRPREDRRPVPAARPPAPPPLGHHGGPVGGLILGAGACSSLLNTGADPRTPPRRTGADVPRSPQRPPPAPAAMPMPVPGPAASSKPPAAARRPPAAPPAIAGDARLRRPPAPRPPPRTPPLARPPPRRRPTPAAPPAAERSPRVTVRLPANLRTGPDGQANIIRVVPRGETLRVHGRTANGWVQVGDAEPRGWLHTSRLGEIVE